MHIVEAVYGPQEPVFQGKMIKWKQKNVINVPRMRITYALVKYHPNDELDMDFVSCEWNHIPSYQKNIKKLAMYTCIGIGKIKCVKK